MKEKTEQKKLQASAKECKRKKLKILQQEQKIQVRNDLQSWKFVTLFQKVFKNFPQFSPY